MLKTSRARVGFPILLVLAVASNGTLADEKLDPKGVAFFEKRIRPVLVQHCHKCHSADAKEVKGGLLLDTRMGVRQGGESGAAIVAGNVDDSLLIEAIRYEGLEMPPNEQLPDRIVADFVAWVKMGAPDPRDGESVAPPKTIDFDEARKFWAFQQPEKHAPPKSTGNWARTDVDRFVEAGWSTAGLKPVADADRRTLIRRLTFDLTGLPPTPEEIAAFENDDSPEALETVIDRLLVSPQFGERWGRHWLDVARFAESTGKERNVPYQFAWRYRNYVIDAFNSDKPYDQFLHEQIAGDLLPADDKSQAGEQIVATGFLALGPKSLNNRNAELYQMEVVDDQIDTTTRAMLGLTVGCARCHDHKFDPIPTTDYYAMAGIFRSTETLSGAGRRGGGKNGYVGNLMPIGSDEELDAWTKHESELADVRKQLNRAQGQLKKLKVAANRTKQKAKGKDDALEKARTRQKEAQETVEQLTAQLKELEQDAPAAPPMAMGVKESGKPADYTVLIAGEVDDRGPSVPRGFVTVVSDGTSEIPKDQSGRLQLSEWIANPNNPLTARVAVNRVWQHLFGEGLVRTVDNFGELGERPTHPELLDTLAVEFMEDGWSVKRLIRRLTLTRVYQLSSAHEAANYEADPDNRQLWRMSRRRLDAESIRDAMLAVSGRLELSRPEGSVVMRQNVGEIGRNLRADQFELDRPVRSIYLPILRGLVPDELQPFDMADPSLVVGRRDVTTVPTQALYMLNSPFVLKQSQHAAERLIADTAGDDLTRIEAAYRRMLGRPATETEADRALAHINEFRQTLGAADKITAEQETEAWASLCQVLFASAEFRYVY